MSVGTLDGLAQKLLDIFSSNFLKTFILSRHSCKRRNFEYLRTWLFYLCSNGGFKGQLYVSPWAYQSGFFLVKLSSNTVIVYCIIHLESKICVMSLGYNNNTNKIWEPYPISTIRCEAYFE